MHLQLCHTSHAADACAVNAGATAFCDYLGKWVLESGEFATMGELAEREGIAPSYMTHVLRLTLLAPQIVEAILDGKQRPGVTMAGLTESIPADWVG